MLQAWLSHPTFELTFEYVKGNDKKIVDKVMERYRVKKIPIEKVQLSISAFADHHTFCFCQIDKWLVIASQNGVKDLVGKFFAPSYPFLFSHSCQ